MSDVQELQRTAISKLKDLGFPPVFEKIYAGEFPPDLASSRQRPGSLSFEPWVAERFGEPIKDYLPLWEDNGNCLLIYSLRDSAFYEWYLEGDELTQIAKSYQQFVTWLLLRKLGAGQQAAAERLAIAFEYRHLPKLLEFAQDEDADDDEIIASIPD
jgi:hypothetical protein